MAIRSSRKVVPAALLSNRRLNLPLGQIRLITTALRDSVLSAQSPLDGLEMNS